MAAATDLFRQSAPLFQTTLSAALTSSSTSMSLSSVVDLPSTTGITLTIDQFSPAGVATPTLREVVTGVVSGSNIIDLIRGQDGTTAQAHAAGAIVQMVFTSQANNDLMTGLTNTLTQGGLLQPGIVTASEIANNTITATQIANATLTNAQIASGTIDYANLLSTIFSGQVTSYANGGTAGGTGYYVNLGGIKLCWGLTASQSSHNSPSYSINWAPSFFTTVQATILNVADVVTDVDQLVANASGNSTTGISAYFVSIANSTSASFVVSWFVIGT